MSELATRKGQRTKKVPKHLQYDDADYGNFLTNRTVDQKEKSSNATEMNQIARLLQKFVTSINQKIRDYHQMESLERSSNENLNPNLIEQKRVSYSQNGENNGQKPSGMLSATGRRGHNGPQRVAGQLKPNRGEPKKQLQGSKGHISASSTLQSDPNFQGLLNDHIRSAYPNIASISPEMLKGMDIPKQLLDAHNGQAKSKNKQEKGKGSQVLKGLKTKQGREELKPFKRQSYHVAIAYHIHLKRIKINNPSAADIDPTYPARKLRQSQNQTMPKQ